MEKAIIMILVLAILGLIGYAVVGNKQKSAQGKAYNYSSPSAVPSESPAVVPSPIFSPILPVTQEERKKMKNYIATIKTNRGEIKIELLSQAAPNTVKNFVTLAKQKYYEGIIFHRVIKDFMLQTGDPTGTGAGGQSAFGKSFDDEINAQSLGLSKEKIAALQQKGYRYQDDLQSLKIEVGTMAMANRGPATNGSQFFIVTQSAQPHLDGLHTAFGKVTEGMDVVGKIAAVAVDGNAKPVKDVVIESITVAEKD